MNPANLTALPMADATLRTLFSIGFLARFSYALARNPVLPLFAAALGAGPEGIGLAMGISTVTGTIFDVGHAAGPIITGLLVAALGYGAAFAIVSTLLCASIPLFLTTVREEPQTVTL